MKLTFVKSKIHRATVTKADLNYKGSITIGKELMQAAGIRPYEFVHINNVNNAAHWETYAIPGNTGDIILNGPPSRIFQPGDKVVILSFAQLEENEIEQFTHTVLFVDEQNSITEIVAQKSEL
jgi:aspartate 1-decarboxylase